MGRVRENVSWKSMKFLHKGWTLISMSRPYSTSSGGGSGMGHICWVVTSLRDAGVDHCGGHKLWVTWSQFTSHLAIRLGSHLQSLKQA